ncbi:MFS transporter [Micromonospora sp. AKA38]|uniref:MFS transporter n=1 Tax=Micromonospora sp. AKA38 TaxID=2733861 RepID=UPI0022BB3FC0|nr:MFS transporter [Micromonospora sp. AKA38]GHJ15504.1 MFS transporter [Micromonospora sp. AKA38]
MTTSLWRNREFNLLWTGQALSELGDAMALLAMPLLVLALTGSPVAAGLVGTAAGGARLLCRLPIGVLVDRVNRRHAMIVADVIRLAAFAGVGAAILTDRVTLPIIVALAVVDAICGSLFGTAEHAALRSIVPVAQLPLAMARNEARSYGTALAGPPLGGFLFGLAHFVPFLGNAISYLASLIGVLLIRKPLQSQVGREEGEGGYAAAIGEGIRFVFTNPFLRAVVIISAPLNFALIGVTFAIVVTLQRNGTSPAVIGIAETLVAAGGLLGAFAAPFFQRRLSLAVLGRLICWAATLLLGVSALLTSSIVAAVPVALVVFLGPACNAALFGHQAAITPDRLQGRVLSVMFLVSNSAAALAPVLVGVMVSAWSGSAAIAVCAGAVGISALIATVGSGLRSVSAPVEDAVAEEQQQPVTSS